MSALRMLVTERDIPLERLMPAIEQALVLAYHKTPGACSTPVPRSTSPAGM